MPPYPWKRYWVENDAKPFLQNGLLAIDPENELIAHPFEFFDHFDCLVLLGDPGLGKSTEIRSISDSTQGRVLFQNLGHITTWNYILHEIFDSEEFRQGITDPSGLTLFLDSLDEGHQNIHGLPEMLSRELLKLERGKLRLRLSCRSAEWSNLNVFRRNIENNWDSQFKEIRLAPLTVTDVHIAADQSGIDFVGFSAAVNARGVGRLASNPKDLGKLLDEFSRNGDLPSSQFELFEKVSLAQFTDPADGRPATETELLSPNARLSIAGRIAATMILSGRVAIWSGPPEECPPSDVTIGELSGYSERMPDETAFQVDELSIKETINKGSFSGIEANRIGISHQIDTEFLAARYLSNHYFSDETLIELIGRDFSFPQLDQISAWIAGQRPSVFDHLVRNSPLVLLRSEAVTHDDEARFKLTERLLQMYEAEETSDDWAKRHYEKLNNSRLAEQLRPYLIDKSKPWLVRRVAIDIAEAAHLTEFQNSLAEVALDDEESLGTRMNAAYAVLRIADARTRARLIPLLNNPNDKDRELRGIALTANFPENLGAEEVFANLDPPLSGFFGSYNMFFYKLGELITSEHLPFALAWLIKQPDSGINYIGLDNLSNTIVAMAWKAAENDDNIFRQLVDLAWSRCRNFGVMLSEPSAFSREIPKETYDTILSDDEMRRRIILRITEESTPENLHFLVHDSVVGLRPNDLPWLVDVWKASESEPLKRNILTLVSRFIGPWETAPESLELIDQMRRIDAEFEARFGPLFEALDLGSTSATEQREYYEKYLKPRNRLQPEREAVSPSPLEQVIKLLDEFEKGNVDAWWQMMRWMAAMPDGWSNISEYESDITKFPVWGLLNDESKTRLVQAALAYLERGNPNDEDWVNKNILYRPAIGGYRAWRLLLLCDPEKIGLLASEIWGKWAATIYFQIESFNVDEKASRSQRQELLERAYKANPDAFSTIVRGDIQRLLESNDYYLEWNKLETVWDENLDAVLLESLDPSLPRRVLRLLLERLFSSENAVALKFACTLVPKSFATADDLNVTEVVLDLMIRYGHDDCWDSLFALIQSSPEDGRRIIEGNVGQWDHKSPTFLSERQLADLFIWLTTQYPHKEDPVHRGSYAPGPRDDIVTWRENVLGTLVNRGTTEAALQVGRIRDSFPDLTYIKFRHFESRENLHSLSWTPWNPKALIRRFAKEPLVKLERRYAQYQVLDPIAERTAKFRYREHTAITFVFWPLVIATTIGIGWEKMEIWTWVLAVVLLLLPRIYESIKLKAPVIFDSYTSILKDEQTKLYSQKGLNYEEAELLRREMIRQGLQSL